MEAVTTSKLLSIFLFNVEKYGVNLGHAHLYYDMDYASNLKIQRLSTTLAHARYSSAVVLALDSEYIYISVRTFELKQSSTGTS